MSGEGAPSPEELVAMMGKPEVQFTAVPMGVQRFATFMQRAGLIKTAPASWKDLFFPEAHDQDGN